MSLPRLHALLPTCAYFNDERLLVVNGMPCYMAWFNKDFEYYDLGLHVVCGSLAFGSNDDPWFEYGGRDWTRFKHFMNSKLIIGNTQFNVSSKNKTGHKTLQDVHIWLEDDEGNVYDIVQTHFKIIEQQMRDYPELYRNNSNIVPGKQIIGFKEGDVIQGMSKDELKTKGLQYFPAPPETSKQLDDQLKLQGLAEYSKIHPQLRAMYRSSKKRSVTN